MSQTILLRQFKKYIDLSRDQSYSDILAELGKAKINSDEDAVNRLEHLVYTITEDCRKLQAGFDKGCCFGFSLIHGAMDEASKLQWWEAALVAIANWDGKKESLDQAIRLTPQTAPIKLKDLFERVVSYVTSHQVEYDEGFKIKNLNQYDFLSPEGHCFEILDDKDIKQVKQRKMTGGYLTHDQLLKLLKENDFTQTISLIHSPTHTIRVYYKEGKWVVYDPNYDHTSLKTIHKEFDNKKDLAEEIFRILGHSMFIEIATCNSSKDIELPAINLLDPEEAAGRLKEYGLHIIAPYYTADALSEILTVASKAKDGPFYIAEALAAQDEEGWTGLHIITHDTPKILSQVLTLASKAKGGPELIAKALAAQDEGGWTGLQTIAHYTPYVLPQILTLVSQAEEGPTLIAEALVSQNEAGWSGLRMITRYAPHVLPQALALASQAENGTTLIAKEFATEDKTGQAGLSVIMQYAPKVLPQFLDLAGRSESGPAFIAHALAKQDSANGETGLQMIAQRAPQVLPQVLDLVGKSEYGSASIARALSVRNQLGQTGLSMIVQSAPKVLPRVLALASQAKNGAASIAQALVTQNQRTGWSGLQMMVYHASVTLPQILTLVGHAKHGAVLIAKALAAQDRTGRSGLHIIIRYVPHLLPQILTLASQAENGSACIAQALLAQSQLTGQTGLQMIEQCAPQALKLIQELFGIPQPLNAANDTHYQGGASSLFSPAGKKPNSTHVKKSLEMSSERRFKLGS